MNLEAVSKALVRSALATEGGDPDAAAEASVHLIELVDEAQEDPARSLQVLHFLMDVCTRSPASSELRALLGAVCLEVVPRLLALADVSPAAAAAAGQLTEAVLAAQGCCSPRELVMALMELYDSHKDSAFVPGSGSVHLLLLGLLRGILPSLVAAVQRRRLKVAFSMLQVVVDLAAGAGRQMLRLTDLTAAAAAAAAAAAGDDGGGAEAGGNSAASGGEVAEALREQAAEAAASLVEPFVEFAEQLHRKVLTKELPPRASATITTAKSDAVADHGDRSDRSKVGAWLLALLGALWPAWASMDAALSFTPLVGGGAAARPAGTPATGSGALSSAAEAAAARLAGLLPFYLPPPPVWSPAAAVGMEEAGMGEGSSAAIRCDSGALGVSWEGLWAAAQAGAPVPREPTGEGEDQGDGDDGGFDGPEEWTLSDPQLARLGAAVVVWLDVCGGYSSRGGSNRRVSSVGLTGFAQAAAVSAAGCAARLPDGFLPCVPPADSEVASLYLLRFIEAHMDASLGGSGVDGGGGEAGNCSSGGSSGHTEPLARALAMISAASLRLQLQRQQWHLSALVPTDAIAATASADVRSSWEALAGHLGAEDTTTEGRAGAAAALQCTSGTERAGWGSGTGTGGQVEEAVTAAVTAVTALLPLVTDAQRAMLPLARRAAQRLLLCMDCAGSEVLRRQCHDSWQALLSLLPPAVRAAVLHHQATALGSTPTVRSIVLQRLQREVASATAAAAQAQATAAAVTPPAGPTAQGVAPQPGAQRPTGAGVGMQPAMVAAFGGPWVLRPVVHSLQALQRQADATTSNAAVTPGGGGSVPPVPVSRATDGVVAVGAVLDNADATVAALSVLRFMALRYAAAGSDSPQAPAVEPRLAVLRAVQRHVVAPLRPLVSRVLEAMQREAAEAEQAATAAAAAAVAGDAMAAQLSAAVTAAAAAAGDRFAGNVAVLSGALSGLTGVSRVAELLDYLQELLG